MDMASNDYLIIMAGGIGSRFWPFSRKTFPKQFHDVLGVGQSLLQMTAQRFEPLIPQENIYIVTNASYKEKVQEQLPWMNEEQILLEPSGKNTGPCIAYAGYKIFSKNPEAQVVVSPSDHFIANVDAFRDRIREGLQAVQEHDILLTLGIKPSRPDTGYGYIQYLEDKLGKCNKVKTFTEKPELDLARKFLESGDFVWNSGIFLWNLKSMRAAFQSHEPEIHDLFEEGMKFYFTDEEDNFIQNAYAQTKSISIDYALMEKAQNVYTLLSDFGWSDLGTWKSLYETQEKDGDMNCVDANAYIKDTTYSIIKSSDPETLIVLDGLEDYIVAHHDRVFMVCRKSEEQRVKEFVNQLKQDQKDEYL